MTSRRLGPPAPRNGLADCRGPACRWSMRGARPVKACAASLTTSGHRPNRCRHSYGMAASLVWIPHLRGWGASPGSCHAAVVTETPSLPAPRNGESVLAAQDRVVGLAELALSVLEEPTVPQTVERVLEFARGAVDCADAAVVFVRAKRRLETVATTDRVIADLIAKQMELQEGPIFRSSTTAAASSWTTRTRRLDGPSGPRPRPRWGFVA